LPDALTDMQLELLAPLDAETTELAALEGLAEAGESTGVEAGEEISEEIGV
jgi:hypothetical protein